MASRKPKEPHPLCFPIHEGDEAEVRRILDASPECLNTPEPGGLTALMFCATYRRPELARVLLDRGANVDAKNRTGMTALHLAAWNHCAPVVRMLIDAGAAVDQVDDSGNTALHHAVHMHTRDLDGTTIQVLIQAGADPRLKNRWGDSPIEVARRSEQGTGRFFEGVAEGA